MKTRLTGVFIILSLLIFTPALVTAEGFNDLFVGGSFSEDDDVKLSAKYNGHKDSVKIDTDFDDAFTIGYRLGYYFEGAPWLGIAGEVSWFSPDPDPDVESVFFDDDVNLDVDLDVYPISALLMLRIPLMKSSDFPYGKYQPYVGIGPSAFISTIDIDEYDFDDTSTDIGLDVKVGFSMFFAFNFGVFVEYRYTSVSADFDDTILGAKIEIDSDLETHHALVGLAFRF